MNGNNSPNKSIGCTVAQCAYHCGSQDYCSLDTILVSSHENNPTMYECTDCKSFRAKSMPIL
jgi:hypothetical protein